MTKFLDNIEINAMRKYGYEVRKTLVICKVVEIIRKILFLPLDK